MVASRTRKLIAFLVLVLIEICTAIPSYAGAQNGIQFPSSIERMIHTEQKLIGIRDTSKDTLDPAYQPEQGMIFRLPTYWVDVEKMTIVLDGPSTPGEIRSLYFNRVDGRESVLFAVHPDEKEYFKTLTDASPAGPDTLIATASASPRSLYTTIESDKHGFSFVNKLSVSKILGGNVRLIHKVELARSLFVSRLLRMEEGLPKSFGFYSEFMVMIPKGWDKGGTILRAIPRAVQEGKVQHIPFFALFAPQPDGSKPLLLQMAEKAQMPFETFYREKILRPFLQQWMELAFEHGITTEPHGQNTLLEVGDDGLPTGRFIHRDFGGFTIDLEYRRQLGLKNPDPVTVNGYTANYNADDVGYGAKTSIDLYFASFVSNLGFQVEEWFKKGWISQPGNEQSLHAQLVRETERAFFNYTGTRIKLENWLANLGKPVVEERAKRAYWAGHGGLCASLF